MDISVSDITYSVCVGCLKIAKMTAPDWQNRILWVGDNLDIGRGMNSTSVDPIYLDHWKGGRPCKNIMW